jgi:hypothetical protein
MMGKIAVIYNNTAFVITKNIIGKNIKLAKERQKPKDHFFVLHYWYTIDMVSLVHSPTVEYFPNTKYEIPQDAPKAVCHHKEYLPTIYNLISTYNRILYNETLIINAPDFTHRYERINFVEPTLDVKW